MSSLSIGIVGLPNVGKSTLFNALTKKSVPADNYPFCTIDPSVGIVPVPDNRLEALSKFSISDKTIPAVVEFVDIAGLVKGASQGEGLGNQFLSHIREVNAIVQVVRIFEDSNITHVEGQIDPIRDIEIINSELILADLDTIEKRLNSLAKEVRRGDKEAIKEESACLKAKNALIKGDFASSADYNDEEAEKIRFLCLLTSKTVIYALNKKAGGKNLDLNPIEWAKLENFLKNKNWVMIDASFENEIREMTFEEKNTFRESLEIKNDGLDDLIKKGYEALNLITFFTTGRDETRAWTILKNSTAPEAGSAIHTDFKEKFIKAEVIFWSDLLDAGSYAKARELGKVRTEGKIYLVKDGDVIEFKV